MHSSQLSRKSVKLLLLFACLFLFHRELSAIEDFTKVAEKAIPAVVSIKTTTQTPERNLPFLDPFSGFSSPFFQHFFGIPEREITPRGAPRIVGQGSGFIISPDGWILTNSHVVRDTERLQVQLYDGREYDAKVIGADFSTDVALIKIDANALPYLDLADSGKLRVGEWAIAIGAPLGLKASLTVGVVSAVGRNQLDLADFEDFIQTDASINHGNSGGPLLNIRGEVIGMNTAIASNSGGNMGIGFAIPSSLLNFVVNQLRNGGEVHRGQLGVVIQNIDYELSQAMGLDRIEGALVVEVVASSPAEGAGIKRGDIIVEVDGRRIENPGALRKQIALTRPGTKVKLKILREGQAIALAVETGSEKKEREEEKSLSTELPQDRELTVRPLTQELAERYGYSGEKGLIVEEVRQNSQAAWVGLSKGTLILEINRQPATSAQQLYQALAEAKKGGRLLLFVKQGKQTRYIAFSAR